MVGRRPAADVNHRAVAPRTRLVDRLSEEVFADAGFAEEQDRRVGGSREVRLGQDALNGLTGEDDLVVRLNCSR